VDLDDVQRDWTRLGEDDPLWAVLIKPGTRHGQWDIDEFLRTGQDEITASLDHLRGLGALPQLDRVLDFGSGAGRLSQALASHAKRVTGVDISAPMIETARRLDRTDNCEFLLNERADLSLFEDHTFDLVYSSLVIQHLPREAGFTFLREMCRVLRPGGALIVQVASTPTMSFKGLAFRYAPKPLLRWAQTKLLDYPAPMRMQAISDGAFASVVGDSVDLLDTLVDQTYGGHWVYHRHFAVKRPSSR
jgi:2-polyprenyl-3-methyl-5-hydroxy-6-metoxy-1,4-benzoquinol methylase